MKIQPASLPKPSTNSETKEIGLGRNDTAVIKKVPVKHH